MNPSDPRTLAAKLPAWVGSPVALAVAHTAAVTLVAIDLAASYRAMAELGVMPSGAFTAVDMARLVAEQRERILRAPELYPLDQLQPESVGMRWPEGFEPEKAGGGA